MGCEQAIKIVLYIPTFVYFSVQMCKCMIGSNCICFIPDCIRVVLEGRYFQIFIAYSFPMIGHTQMPRKFRLGRMRKNVERKRQKACQARGTNKIGRASKKRLVIMMIIFINMALCSVYSHR